MRDETNIGYERILIYLKECQKATPTRVAIKRTTRGKNTYLSLQIKIGAKPIEKTANDPCTMQGITDTLKKAQKCAEALKHIHTESEFLAWYDSEILKINIVRNDLVTFGEAIAKVEATYWKGTDKKRNR